jgi:putative ABC transport system permease protein
VNLLDILSETFASLSGNKARSALTILGIVVGIAAVITLVSVGQGSTASIESSIQNVGSNLVTINNMDQTGDGLTTADATALGEINGVKSVSATVSSSFTIVAGENSQSASVTAIDGNYAEAKSITVTAGNFISAYDNEIRARAVVLGPDMVTELWSQGYNPVGKTVRINGIVFTVVGVTKAKTSSDTSVYIPLTTAQASLTGKGSYSSVLLEAKSEDVMTRVTNEAEALLMARHGIASQSEEDFMVVSQSDLLDMASSITGTLTMLLAAIASISLIVGGIGIMNMMLTSVTERIREIGLRKAIGATPANITTQFLVEAIILTLTGGIIGVLLGWGIAQIITLTGVMTTVVTSSSVILAVSVCMLIGLVFGFYPARRAAKLNPLEALRYQ